MAEIEECIECGGFGFDAIPCSSCGKKKGTLDLTSMTGNTMQKFLSKIGSLGIPDHYKGIEWTSQTFWRTKVETAKLDGNLVKFVERLEKFHNIFGQGMIPSDSLVIISPGTLSKVVLAHSCMQLAVQAGHTVAPLLDTVEVKRLMVLAGERPGYKLYKTIDYDEWLMSSVMFVTVTKTEYAEEASQIMQELLDTRSRKGLPTFFLSRYPMSVLSKKDKSNAFNRHVSLMGTFDKLKYPAVIEYVEYFKKGVN
jgi:hypothetical protein